MLVVVVFAGIDYTMSNHTQGQMTFGGRSLHSIDGYGATNPYQQVGRAVM